MGTNHKKQTRTALSGVQRSALDVSSVVDTMQYDPKVISFDVKVDKATGLIRYNARTSDGRVITQTMLGPGLEEIVRYDPSKVGIDDRDLNIRKLLDTGLTQTEVATRMGVSQALVSKVHRATKK